MVQWECATEVEKWASSEIYEILFQVGNGNGNFSFLLYERGEICANAVYCFSFKINENWEYREISSSLLVVELDLLTLKADCKYFNILRPQHSISF